MSACCVSGCKNRQSSTSELKFYPIPCGFQVFQANRRGLWLQAIQRANGSSEALKRNARVCGAHFISQEASMEFDSPDFVPSVFTCTKESPNTEVKRFHSCRRSRRLTGNVEIEEKTTPPGVDSPVDPQPFVSMEEIQTPSTPSVPQDGETLTKEPETETTPVKSQTTISPHKASPSSEAPAGISQLDKGSPIVLLKRIYVPVSGYQCEKCKQSFTNVAGLMKHQKLHDGEEISFVCENCGKYFTSQPDFAEHQCVYKPSFPCNMCDRSFTTSHNLKRHKLLHLKDGRKCHVCGVLFCQLHNHILYLPSADTMTEYEEDSPTVEPQNVEGSLKLEPRQNADLDHDAQSNRTGLPGPLSRTRKTPASRARISKEIDVPVYLTAPSLPGLLPPVPKRLRTPLSLPRFTLQQPHLPQHPELPPSLKLFSPQYLTSAFLEVKRNYEYILSKPISGNKNTVKEEQCELPLISPD